MSVSAAVAEAAGALGPLSILVNNSGISVAKPTLEQTEDDWSRVLDTSSFMTGSTLTVDGGHLISSL